MLQQRYVVGAVSGEERPCGSHGMARQQHVDRAAQGAGQVARLLHALKAGLAYGTRFALSATTTIMVYPQMAQISGLLLAPPTC